MLNFKKIKGVCLWALAFFALFSPEAFASEIDLKIPSLDVAYNILGYSITGSQILLYGLCVCSRLAFRIR